MLAKKICMIGDFGVGKTSLVARYVNSVFSERYLTTVGIKVDSKLLELQSGDQVKLVLWDIAGKDALSSIEKTYLRGAAGYILVVDGLRQETLDTAVSLHSQVEQELGPVPFNVMLNKHDLVQQWELNNEQLRELESRGWILIRSSAKNGEGVEESFRILGERILAP